MIPVLEFIFRDFWTWLGTLFLILAAGAAVKPLISIKSVRNDD